MAEEGDSRDPWGDADRLYAARAAIADVSAQGRIGIAELVRFLTDAGSDLTHEAQRALFASPRLRTDFERLKQRLRLVELPELAAASAGGIMLRTFEGGSVRVHPSRIEGQVYMVFQFQEGAGTPRALLLDDGSDRVAKRSLPEPDSSGRVVLVLDRNDSVDGLFLQLFSDATATGSFFS